MHAPLPADAVGLMLKDEFANELLAQPGRVELIEVHAENLMVDGGPALRRIERLREHHSLSLHGVGASLGGEDGLDSRHLARLAALVERFEPARVSEHLAWSAAGGVCFPDLLPIVYDEPTLARTCRRVDALQTWLRRRVLIENPSSYLEFQASTMSEAQFIAELVHRTGCALLLDVNNVHVSSTNLARDARASLAALPLAAVEEIHLAGFARDGELLIDSHGAAVDAAVWSLYEHVLRTTGPVPTVIERDADVPPLALLLAEAAQARAALHAASGACTAPRFAEAA